MCSTRIANGMASAPETGQIPPAWLAGESTFTAVLPHRLGRPRGRSIIEAQPFQNPGRMFLDTRAAGR